MRVALVITSLGAGGTERSTAVLLPELRSRGVDPVVFCLYRRDTGDHDRVVDAGIDVRVLPAGPPPRQVAALRRELTALAPALVHTAIYEADIVGRVAGAGVAPVLSSLVNTSYAPARLEDPNVRRHRLVAARELDRMTGHLFASHFHAVTEGVAADAMARLGIARSRISVIERGRDPGVLGRRRERRDAARARLGLGSEPFVLAAGRQEYQKAHVQLVAATRLLAERHRDLVVAVAGREGNATDSLERAVRDAGLQDRFRLLGHRDDVADLLAAADVFAMPSTYEGTAGAAIEALALEAPIVASRLAGTRGVLDDDVALLVPPADPVPLAEAIADVLARPDAARARAVAGRARFEDRFTLSRSADRLVELYGRVAAMRPRRRSWP